MDYINYMIKSYKDVYGLHNKFSVKGKQLYNINHENGYNLYSLGLKGLKVYGLGVIVV